MAKRGLPERARAAATPEMRPIAPMKPAAKEGYRGEDVLPHRRLVGWVDGDLVVHAACWAERVAAG